MFTFLICNTKRIHQRITAHFKQNPRPIKAHKRYLLTPTSKVLASRCINPRTMLRRQQTVRLPSAHLHLLLIAMLVPHMHRIAFLRHFQRLIDARRVEKIPPILPANRIECVDVEHLEAATPVARHQRRKLCLAHCVQHSRYDARPVVAPVATVEAAPELLQAQLRKAMAFAAMVHADDAGGDELHRFGARIVGRNRAHVAHPDDVQIEIGAAVFV